MLRRCLDCSALTFGTRCFQHERIHERSRRPSAKDRGYDGAWEKVRLKVLDRDNYVCRLRIHCDGATATSVDHVTPLHKGGARLDPGNLVAACRACNSAKGAR